MASTILSRSALQARRRAIVKTLCYRLFMLAITVTIAFVVVGDFGDAVNIGLAANVLKTGTYYVYERLWDRIAWGVETV
ncbi:MAG: DUF2061 domain-containing protein [Natronomonas sp.]|jgi:uncharacterized membrane protein|uniref:DUF2061 domain-containing protein n=1 Tax=Natronomonas sp. TaxID=2184060 RepID=UPI002870757A|nr:DUF2061 domain-containing protein [Natronomonas sp.]MDR9381295.1 DUF2061 domain-containing protein [Natronomonas sp.]MDR9429358.1 DUF2061 domain-containing protein [Natronomonas sp.]